MVAAIALGFAACNNEDVPEVNEGGTFARVTVQQAQLKSGLRATEEDVVGTTDEDKVHSGYLFFETKAGIPLSMTGTPSAVGNNHAVYTSQAIETEPMTDVTLAVFLNNRLNLNLTDYKANATFSINDLDKVIGTSGFLMTSTAKVDANNKKTISPNIAKTEVEDGANTNNESKNNFNFDVERVVAKVQVHAPGAAYTMEGVTGGTINTSTYLKYALAGSAKTSYLFRDNASDRQLGTDNRYGTFKSAIHDVAAPELQKMSDAAINATITSNFAVKDFNTNDDAGKSANGIYFLENSYNPSSPITGPGQLKYSRIAYVKVYTSFTPTGGKKLDGGVLTDANASDYSTSRQYRVSVTNNWYNDHLPAAGYDYTGSGTPEDPYMLLINDAAGTFYIGADGVFYTTLDAARLAGNTSAKKYVGGKMVYKTPVNSQLDNTGTYTEYADTRRNNIYQLTITGFSALGENYDWTDPDDPEIKKPEDNPDEPTTPDDPVDPAKTYMRVHAKILNWNMVQRNVVLK